MKIQLKRSNVLQAGQAKPPTAPQMEFGELAVNYNSTDPVIFIKNSDGEIIRLTNIQVVEWDDIENKPDVFDANDGKINIDAGEGLAAAGKNATANQSVNTTRTLSAVGLTGYGIDVDPNGIRIGDNWSEIPQLD